MPDVQILVTQLQEALGLSVICGSITLNVNDSLLQSVKTETYQRIAKIVDRRAQPRQD